jgi:hypothetical protein
MALSTPSGSRAASLSHSYSKAAGPVGLDNLAGSSKSQLPALTMRAGAEPAQMVQFNRTALGRIRTKLLLCRVPTVHGKVRLFTRRLEAPRAASRRTETAPSAAWACPE